MHRELHEKQPRNVAVGSNMAHQVRKGLTCNVPLNLEHMPQIVEFFGGAKRDRTADLLVANEALSQLSYSPTNRAGTLSSILAATLN